MADKVSSLGSSPLDDPSYSGSYTKPPLTISTSRPDLEWARRRNNNQSPPSSPPNDFAQPPSAATSPSYQHQHQHQHENQYHPLSPPSSPYPAPLRSATTPASTSTGLRFASITGARKPSRPEEPRRKSGTDINATSTTSRDQQRRRSSGEGKNNVYTRSGRHGDEWLFGGWGDAVKRMWERDEKSDS